MVTNTEKHRKEFIQSSRSAFNFPSFSTFNFFFKFCAVVVMWTGTGVRFEYGKNTIVPGPDSGEPKKKTEISRFEEANVLSGGQEASPEAWS
jgi:hypothetical protein